MINYRQYDGREGHAVERRNVSELVLGGSVSLWVSYGNQKMNMMAHSEKYGVIFVCSKNRVAVFRAVWATGEMISAGKMLECGQVGSGANF